MRVNINKISNNYNRIVRTNILIIILTDINVHEFANQKFFLLFTVKKKRLFQLSMNKVGVI